MASKKADIRTMFGNANNGQVISDEEMDDSADDAASKGAGGNKRLSIERIYQKKTQLEHILLRPDTYIGSIEKLTQPMWVVDDSGDRMVQREVTFVPGLYKIFDEILVNAADNKQNDPNMNCIKIDIDQEQNKVKIWNNGRGIPVTIHKDEKLYVPTMIFGRLLTSSNYNDDQKKVTGGRNGYGAKLCNIFSTKFQVETSYKGTKKAFRQVWENNMGKESEPKIIADKGEDYTCVTFHPDLAKFKMDCLDDDIVALFSRRAYDIAASNRGVKVFLNGKKLPIKNFKDYVDFYLKDKEDDNGHPLKLVHEVCDDRWEVAVTLSEKGFQQVSFVNSIATTKGGRHADYICDQIVAKLIEVVKKKEKKGSSFNIKPYQIKSHIWVFVSCLIENPTFDSQTKENMTLQPRQFGSKCILSEKFINQVSKCGIVDSIMSWLQFKTQEKLSKKCTAGKHSKLKGLPKLDDANDAGTRNSNMCTLILTEGDSAKSLAVAGLSVLGRDRYGVFPLKGKVLNVRDATPKSIMENAEINNIIKIMGLQYKEKYSDPDSLKKLRYGKIMIMTDQDQDGSHIKGLLINFIHSNWPNLLKHRFLEEFITPIVKVIKKDREIAFYSLPEFEEWKSSTPNWNTWRVKYYKGLGTSTEREAKEYFSDMVRHRILFRYGGAEDDSSIMLAFSKKNVEQRKEWLTNWMDERKRRTQLGLPELYLYGKDTRAVTYNEFVNRELILFSNMDNERSIPSVVDGLKPGQRKVMFTCLEDRMKNEIKVAQLAGKVAQRSAYHHGEMSLTMTMINLAQNFVGSNNINLLMPNGQFGTRLHGGKDAASPRYIFTQLSPLARLLFNRDDFALLEPNFDDNQRIEPVYYVPILPLILVNGAEGIGTGWSTRIQNYDPREIINNLRRMMEGLEPLPMHPWYKNYTGSFDRLDNSRYVNHGEINEIDDTTVEITELPIRVWTSAYKESVMEPMLLGGEKVPAVLSEYKDYSTTTTVRYVVKMTPEKMAAARQQGLHKFFKLQTTVSTQCMVLFDHNGCIRRYESAEDILKEFFHVRMEYYVKRKEYLEGRMTAESLRMDNKARFILEKIDGKITIENKRKAEMIQTLVRAGYDSDPLKAWEKSQKHLKALEGGDRGEANEEEDEQEEVEDSDQNFNYLLDMKLWSLTKEKKDELCKERDKVAEELYKLRKKTPTDLWKANLEEFLVELEKQEANEKETEAKERAKDAKKGGRVKAIKQETFARGIRIVPHIDDAIKIKAEKATAARKKKEVKAEKIMDFDEESNSSEPKSLAERINAKKSPIRGGLGSGDKKPKKAAPKEPKVKKEPRSASTDRKSPKKKGGKKRNPWSDAEDSDAEDFDEDDIEMDADITPVQRHSAPRRGASKKVKYQFSDDEGEDKFSDSENSVVSSKAKQNGHSQDDGNAIEINDPSDDDEFVPLTERIKAPETKAPAQKPVAKTTKPAAKPKGESAPKKKLLSKKQVSATDVKQPGIQSAFAKKQSKKTAVIDVNSDDDFVISDEDSPIKKKTAAKKKIVSSQESASSCFFNSPVKKTTVKTSTRLCIDSDDDSPVKPVKKAAKSKKISDDEDDWDILVGKKPPAKKKRTKADSDEDFDAMEEVSTETFSSRATTGRSRAPAKYNFDDDSDSN